MIVHYAGKEVITFIGLVSDAIANEIKKEYDERFINKVIQKNYFYIMPQEQASVKRIALKILSASEEEENYGKEILKNLLFEYFAQNNKMILEGFVNFRIKEYLEVIDYVVELAVISYLNIM